MNTIKKMDIREFRKKGYLQELNRRFLHPLGLALEVVMNDDKPEALNGIWDYREDAEEIIYGIENSSKERQSTFLINKKFVDDESRKRAELRKEKVGFIIEPIVGYEFKKGVCKW